MHNIVINAKISPKSFHATLSLNKRYTGHVDVHKLEIGKIMLFNGGEKNYPALLP